MVAIGTLILFIFAFCAQVMVTDDDLYHWGDGGIGLLARKLMWGTPLGHPTSAALLLLFAALRVAG